MPRSDVRFISRVRLLRLLLPYDASAARTACYLCNGACGDTANFIMTAGNHEIGARMTDSPIRGSPSDEEIFASSTTPALAKETCGTFDGGPANMLASLRTKTLTGKQKTKTLSSQEGVAHSHAHILSAGAPRR